MVGGYAFNFRASNYTHIAAGETDSLIEAGGTITVYQIAATNGGAATAQILIEENDGSTTIQILQVPPGDTIIIHEPFLAKNGVAITTPSDCTATVYHSNRGA